MHQLLWCLHLKSGFLSEHSHKADASSTECVPCGWACSDLSSSTCNAWTPSLLNAWAPSFHWSEKLPQLDGRLMFILPVGNWAELKLSLCSAWKEKTEQNTIAVLQKRPSLGFLGRILGKKKSLKFVSEVKGHKGERTFSAFTLTKILAWDQGEGHWCEQENWPVSVVSWEGAMSWEGLVRNYSRNRKFQSIKP